MKRVRAEALALVNWRGVFYQHYPLDPHVTALEGDNAAGKTTVMIGAYIVLLPDLHKLRFTNLGETAATGGDRGIYGRLGRPGPSYSALDLRLPDRASTRIVAGVLVIRRAQPLLEMKPFVIEGLSAEVPLDAVLLDRRAEEDEIPELDRVKQLAALQGASARAFDTHKEYFGWLFERGITPLRLAGDEERTKLNEMLRTSMRGGISDSLGKGLRDFLLREETGLADTLKRMRNSLDACRTTRFQVGETCQIEGEISKVYEAGQNMVAAAIYQAKARADDLSVKVEEARAAALAAERRRDAVRRELLAVQQERLALLEELDEIQTALQTAKDQRDRLVRALEILARVEEHERNLAAAQQSLEGAERAERTAEEERERAKRVRDEASVERERAMTALGDFNRAYEDLQRRAGAHRTAVEQLARARQSLPDEPLEPAGLADIRTRAEGRLKELDLEIGRLDRQISVAAGQRAEHARVLDTLNRVVRGVVLATEAYERATATLAHLRELDGWLEELPTLPGRVAEARRKAERQERFRKEAARLSTEEMPLASVAAVQEAHQAAEQRSSESEGRHREAEAAIGQVQARLEAARAQIKNAEALLPRWREVRQRALAFHQRFGLAAGSGHDLSVASRELTERRDSARAERQGDEQALLATRRELEQLEQMGGQFDEALLRARDAVSGELFAGRFDDIELSLAGTFEALLGPLAQAIVVDDVSSAAERLAREPGCPSTVWLVGPEAPIALDVGGRPPGTVLGEHALVEGPNGWRLTRIPAHPTLGQQARDRRIAALRQEAQAAAERASERRTRERELDEGLSSVADLLKRVELLERLDPASEVAAGQALVAELDRELARLRSEADLTKAERQRCATRKSELAALLPQAHLLEEEDYGQVAAQLEGRLTAARSAKDELHRVRTDRLELEKSLMILRSIPPSEAEVGAWRAGLRDREEERDRLKIGIDALRYVEEHLDALADTGAEEALAKDASLAPELQERAQQTQVWLSRREDELRGAEERYGTAHKTLTAAQGRHGSVVEELERAQAALAAIGVEHPSAEALTDARRSVDGLEDRRSDLAESERSLENRIATLTERAGSVESEVTRLSEELREEEARLAPVAEQWTQVKAFADGSGLSSIVFGPELAGRYSNKKVGRLQQDVKAAESLLLERLEQTLDGRPSAERIRALVSGDAGRVETITGVWSEVRDWFKHRVPLHISEDDDPLVALTKVQERLARLEEKLIEQENTLRSQSLGVGRSIDTSITRARSTIRRLTDDLAKVRFGSIRSVRIRVERVERMEKILNALKEGQAQAQLFRADMPFEAALETLFQQFGGGSAGAQKILDYREYLELSVEVMRQSGRDWEPADPNHMSTGEAIGVGAAAMMVVLTSWERDANLFRAKQDIGTLRLLFLDEANRLSQNNLAVLFDLCQNLDLQLIIAAPEVERAEGNTTYRLVRQGGQGREEIVRVHGRRAVQPEKP